ncbi:MAG: hypothetical protein ABIU05_02820 [Nitrospirales bacterium]
MRIRNLIAVVIVCLFVLQCISFIGYLNEEEYLLGLMDRVAPRSLPPSEQAIKVVESLKVLPVKDFSALQQDNRYFLLPIFSFLRPMPRQVMEQGGDCADRSRLVIRMLRLHGIGASKWALYTKEMKSVHAVVELEAEAGKMVADPLYGLWFPRPEGGYYDIKELRQSPSILQGRIQTLLREGVRPGSSDLKSYPIDEYTYQYAKSINWEKWAVTWPLYKALRIIMGSSIDNLQRPAFVEAPQIMVAIMAAVLQGCLIIIYFALVRMNRNMKRAKSWSV